MRRFLIPFAFLAMPVQAANPIAEVICGPSDEVRDHLTQRMGETLQGSGIRDPESMVEVWSSERGSWTLVINHAHGQRCIVAMGEAWDGVTPPSIDPA